MRFSGKSRCYVMWLVTCYFSCSWGMSLNFWLFNRSIVEVSPQIYFPTRQTLIYWGRTTIFVDVQIYGFQITFNWNIKINMLLYLYLHHKQFWFVFRHEFCDRKDGKLGRFEWISSFLLSSDVISIYLASFSICLSPWYMITYDST